MAWLRIPSPSFAHLARPLVRESAPKAPPPAPSSSFIVWPSPCGGGMLTFGCTASQSSPLSGWFSLTVCTIYFLLFFNLYFGMCSSTYDFICALVITHFCLKYLKYLQALTSNLQAESKDIVAAVGEVDNVIATLQNARDNIDTYHSRWFATVEKMCTGVGTECSVPRRCSRQTHRSNIPADSPSQYYCRLISIPLLDHLLSEIRSTLVATSKQLCWVFQFCHQSW